MTTPSHRTGWPRVLLLAWHLLPPAAAHAQAIEPKMALAVQGLYEQAMSEMDALHYQSACPKLEEVTRLVPDALGAKLSLGACYEGWGKLASAWSQYAMVEAMASRVGQGERAEKAGERAAALKPKLAMLAIEVPGSVRSTRGLVITRDGVSVGDAQWAVPLPVDAGGHEIVVSAPGRKPWRKQLEVDAEGARIFVHVAPLEIASVPGENDAESPASERPWQRPASVVSMGVGAAGLAVGAVFGGLALVKNSESNKGHCDAQDRCDGAGITLRREAVSLGNGSTVALLAGGVLAAGGVALFVTAPAPRARNVRAGLKGAWGSAEVLILPGGMALQGVW